MTISFSKKVAAQECGLSERTLNTAIRQGALKVLRVGKRVLITPEALKDFVIGTRQNKRTFSHD